MLPLLLAAVLLLPVATPGADAVSPAGDAASVRAVRAVLVAWRDAWERRDVAAFGETISQDYRAGDAGRAELLAQKKATFAKTARVEVGMQDVEIRIDGDRASVSFLQSYASDRHSDRGKKTLALAKENGRWSIVSESFEPSR